MTSQRASIYRGTHRPGRPTNKSAGLARSSWHIPGDSSRVTERLGRILIFQAPWKETLGQ